jgi:hypothetical protein
VKQETASIRGRLKVGPQFLFDIPMSHDTLQHFGTAGLTPHMLVFGGV